MLTAILIVSVINLVISVFTCIFKIEIIRRDEYGDVG